MSCNHWREFVTFTLISDGVGNVPCNHWRELLTFTLISDGSREYVL